MNVTFRKRISVAIDTHCFGSRYEYVVYAICLIVCNICASICCSFHYSNKCWSEIEIWKKVNIRMWIANAKFHSLEIFAPFCFVSNKKYSYFQWALDQDQSLFPLFRVFFFLFVLIGIFTHLLCSPAEHVQNY